MSCDKVSNDATCACRYETIIATLCDSLDSLDEPEARAAMVWIIGEYAERIDNADELLESFLEVGLDWSNEAVRRLEWYQTLVQKASLFHTHLQPIRCLRPC